MGALEAIIGLGALLGVGYYVISIANKTPISIPFLTPPTIPAEAAAVVTPSSSPPVTPTSTSTPTSTTKTKKPSNKQQEKQPEPEPDAPILTPTSSEMTSPNVAGTSFTFNVVGDIDDNALAAATATNLCGSSPTVTLIIGDFAYHCNAQKWWTGSMKACNGKNNLGSVGNHDCNGKGYLDLFPANGGKWEFTKKIGNIAFIAVNTGYCDDTCMNPSTSEPLFQQAQADPSVKFIVAHFHKPIFVNGSATADAPMSLHNMMKKYPKVKMAFAGHNHKYVRYVPQNGIQYITAGRGGHDATGKEPITKGWASNTVGVVKCRVGTDGGMSCQYVANSGEVLDSWGLTADGKHTGSGGATPKGGTAPSESGYAAAYPESYFAGREDLLNHYYSTDKEDRDNAVLDMMFQQELRLHPRRQFNNTVYHYSKYARQNRRY